MVAEKGLVCPGCDGPVFRDLRFTMHLPGRRLRVYLYAYCCAGPNFGCGTLAHIEIRGRAPSAKRIQDEIDKQYANIVARKLEAADDAQMGH
jgi:hypothetical protein